MWRSASTRRRRIALRPWLVLVGFGRCQLVLANNVNYHILLPALHGPSVTNQNQPNSAAFRLLSLAFVRDAIVTAAHSVYLALCFGRSTADCV
eukprot:7663812-Pyramimonas_sp.AAC.1